MKIAAVVLLFLYLHNSLKSQKNGSKTNLDKFYD